MYKYRYMYQKYSHEAGRKLPCLFRVIRKTCLIYRTCMRRVPARPVCACFVQQ